MLSKLPLYCSCTQIHVLYLCSRANGVSYHNTCTNRNAAPYLAEIVWQPSYTTFEVGSDICITATAYDQYGDPMQGYEDFIFTMPNAAIGTYIIQFPNAQANSQLSIINSQLSITVLPPYQNLALHCPAVASSEENAGTLAINATDGNNTTRWGSAHRDGETLTIDLQQMAYIAYLRIAWETAYASHYLIQGSSDGTTYTTLADKQGAGGSEKIELNETLRYIRLVGLERATQYGISLYELEAYGVPVNVNTTDLFGIDITPKVAALNARDSLQLTAKGYTMQAIELPITPVWSILEGDATITPNGLLRVNNAGFVTIQAATDILQAAQTLYVNETEQVTGVSISPKEIITYAGAKHTFTASTLNQFDMVSDYKSLLLETVSDYKSLLLETVGDSIELLNDHTFKVKAVGEYMIIAKANAQLADTLFVTAIDIAEMNLALNKPVTVSSYENAGTVGKNLNDGDMETRWGSLFSDPQWLKIDLLRPYLLQQIEIDWETASAAEYDLQLSTDGLEWTTVAEYREHPERGNRTDAWAVNDTAQYIRVNCLQRTTEYGYSIYELRAYGQLVEIEEEPVTGLATPETRNANDYELYDLLGRLIYNGNLNSQFSILNSQLIPWNLHPQTRTTDH